jgi:hypothetical protein
LCENMKFWEQLIGFFPWNDMDHNRKNTSKNSSILACVFVAAVTILRHWCLAAIRGFLPSRCLATEGDTHRYTN